MAPNAWGVKKRKLEEKAEREAGYAMPTDVQLKYQQYGNENVNGTWSSYDRSTGQFNYDQKYKEDFEERPYYDQPEYASKTYNERAEVFAAKFTEDKDIMRDNVARSEFDVRNQRLLGLGGSDRSRLVINNEVGDLVLQTTVGENRQVRNLDGSYTIIGSGKKGYLKEQSRRIEERNAEMDEAWRVVDAWYSLSEEEKERHRAKRREVNRELMKSLFIREVEDIPEDVTSGSVDLFDLDDLNNLTLDDTTSENSTRSSTHTRDRVESRVRQPANAMGSSMGSSMSSSIGSPPLRSPPLRSPSVMSSVTVLGDDASVRSTRSVMPAPRLDFQLAYRPRPAPVEKALHVEKPLRVEKNPTFYPPPEDVKEEPFVPEKYLHIVKRLRQDEGRVVTIRLDPKVTTPFPEALTDRLWGGMIQQVVFDPSTKHALVVFVTSVGAKAFIQHFTNMAAKSEHEIRRRQIAVEWYEGDETKARIPALPNLARWILFYRATRVLIIKNVYKSLKKQDVEAGFRSSIGADHLACKCCLVVPTKLYEKVGDRSNSLVVEFASIKDAVEVRFLINDGRLGDTFRGCEARFAHDPADKPPPEQPYCDCKWCVNTRADRDKIRPTERSVPTADEAAFLESPGRVNPFSNLSAPVRVASSTADGSNAETVASGSSRVSIAESIERSVAAINRRQRHRNGEVRNLAYQSRNGM